MNSMPGFGIAVLRDQLLLLTANVLATLILIQFIWAEIRRLKRMRKGREKLISEIRSVLSALEKDILSAFKDELDGVNDDVEALRDRVRQLETEMDAQGHLISNIVDGYL